MKVIKALYQKGKIVYYCPHCMSMVEFTEAEAEKNISLAKNHYLRCFIDQCTRQPDMHIVWWDTEENDLA